MRTVPLKKTLNSDEALSAAQHHLQAIADVDRAISECKTAVSEDERDIASLREQRATTTNKQIMFEVSSKLKMKLGEMDASVDRLQLLHNQRRALIETTSAIRESFIQAHNAIASHFVAEFRQKYSEFLESSVRPLVETGQALAACGLGEIGLILAGINLRSENGRANFVLDGALVRSSPAAAPEAIAARAEAGPWSEAAAQLMKIENQMQSERRRETVTAEKESRDRQPAFTSANMGGMPPAPKPPGFGGVRIEYAGQGRRP